MTPSIRSIETAVPATTLKQPEVRDIFATQPGVSRLGRRLIHAVFDASAIDTRHTVISELGGPGLADAVDDQPGGAPALFFDSASGAVLAPSTGARNAFYARHAPDLFLAAARRALAAAYGIEATDVSHVVTVSCTGFYAPGPDFEIVRDLGLRSSTQRYHLGFMGCYGAFPALRAARAFCQADPSAVVLVVCVELCSIHLHSADDADRILSSSVFADGAAAAVVSARPPAAGETVLTLDAFETALAPAGETDMAWTIGDTGFDMTLSSYVPKIISAHLRDALAPLLAVEATVAERPAVIEHWAVHPGGRSILDRVQRSLELSDAQLEPSREVLREFGNMSSATVLFVLRRILHGGSAQGADTSKRSPSSPERVCAMAFGPGLTVESALMTRRVG